MLKPIPLCLSFILLAGGATLDGPRSCESATAAKPTPVKVIFDTDIESDVDDVGAVAVLHALADRGEAEIIAMGISATNEWCAPCLDGLNTYYGRAGIPIGVVKGPGAPKGESKYCKPIAEEFPHKLKSGNDAPDAVEVYRRALARQPDRSVVMVSVGFLTNFANLLNSKADVNSPLEGPALVRRKVKAWVCMGGTFPKGREWNVHRDAASSQRAIADWPTPIIFSGFEIGRQIFTGAELKETPETNPIRRCYELYNGLKNRESWDQTAVLYAVRGRDGKLDDVWTRSAAGLMRVAPDGSNDFLPAVDGLHTHLVQKLEPAKVGEMIEALMVLGPRR